MENREENRKNHYNDDLKLRVLWSYRDCKSFLLAKSLGLDFYEVIYRKEEYSLNMLLVSASVRLLMNALLRGSLAKQNNKKATSIPASDFTRLEHTMMAFVVLKQSRYFL